MHSTADARFALVCLLVLTGTVVLARMGEARWAARPGAPRAAVVRDGTHVTRTGEGDALRDGRAIDVNRASAAELTLLPGVGPKLAGEIVLTRTREGAFRKLEDLGRVRGIGDKTLAKLAPLVRLGSEGLEHAADTQRDVGRVEALAPALDKQRAANVESERPAAREQVVDTQHDMPAHP